MKAITYDDILLVPSYNHRESRKLDFIEITPAGRTESMPHRLE